MEVNEILYIRHPTSGVSVGKPQMMSVAIVTPGTLHGGRGACKFSTLEFVVPKVLGSDRALL